MRNTKLIGILCGVSLCALSWAQPDVSLRTRIQDQFMNIYALCAVEFPLGSETFVAFGLHNGLAFYRYTPSDNNSIRPAGSLRLYTSPAPATIYDIDEASGANPQQRMLAAVVQPGRILLARVEVGSSGVGITPYGVVANLPNVQRVQIEPIGTNRYLIAAGTTEGEVVIYDWTVPATPAPFPETGINLTPAQRLRADSGGQSQVWYAHRFEYGVRALRMWRVGADTFIAAGGRDGVLTLWRSTATGFTAVAKALRHPAPIVEIAVVGSRLAVALENGFVVVWNWSSTALSYAYAIKDVYAPLAMHSLCAMPNNRLAVATGFVRVYNLTTGNQEADFGGTVFGAWRARPYISDTFHDPPLWELFPNLLYPIRLLPTIASNSYFVKIGWDEQGRLPRTDFIVPSGSYEVRTRPAPVYALAFDGNQMAEGRADGVVQWGSFTHNFGEPVFALQPFNVPGSLWLIGSYGAGNVFAWRFGQSPILNILPAPPNPRIIYQIALVSANASEVRFVTAASDGTVELWAWNFSGTATRIGNPVQTQWPLHSLSVEANRQFVAAGSFAFWRRATNEARAWLINLSTAGLSNPRPIQGMFTEGGREYFFPCVAVFHPTTARFVALSTPRFQVARLLNPDGTRFRDWVLCDFSNRPASGAQPHHIQWLSGSELATAPLYQGLVTVHRLTSIVSHPPFEVVGRGGSYWMGGVFYDRALQNVYEPHQGRVYALIAPTSGELATCGADRRVVRWLVRLPVASSFASSWLPSLDFSPESTPRYVFPAFFRRDSATHALLWWTFDLPTLAAPASSASSNLVGRAFTPGFAQDLSSTSTGVRVHRYISQDTTTFYGFGVRPYWNGRVEVSEDGAWVLTQVDDAKRGGNLFVRFYITPEAALNTVQTPEEVGFSTSWGTDGRTYVVGEGSHAALSPSGTRIALCALGSNGIRIYDRAGSSWNFSAPTRVINLTPPIGHQVLLKFAADDVLLVLFFNTTVNRYQMQVYQLDSSNNWVLRQTFDLNWRELDKRYSHIIDVVPAGTSRRIAVITTEGLRFYQLTYSGGVASVSEVGRAGDAANGFLNVRDCTWVRFSRTNPNLLATANGTHAVVYDLSGLFSW